MTSEDMDIVIPGEDDEEMKPECSSSRLQKGTKKSLTRLKSDEAEMEPNINNCHKKMVDITRDKPIKVTIRVVVPVKDHPKFNFVGKLLGPKGNSLKRLQEETMTKMAILGRGSMRDRAKEDELRSCGDPRFSHLLDDLHVEITAFASPAEAHARIAHALCLVRRFLVPDYNDDIRQEQMWEMHNLLNNGSASSETPLVVNNDEEMTSASQNNEMLIVPSGASPALFLGDNNNNVGCHNNGAVLSGACFPPNGGASPPISPEQALSRSYNANTSPPHQGANNTSLSAAALAALGRKRPLPLGVQLSAPPPPPPQTSTTVATASHPQQQPPATHMFMSPNKRTVMSILSKAKVANLRNPQHQMTHTFMIANPQPIPDQRNVLIGSAYQPSPAFYHPTCGTLLN